MIRLNQKNLNTPEYFSKHFNNSFGVSDIERFELLAKHFKGGTYVDVGVWDSPMPVILSERFPGSTIYAFDFANSVIDFLAKRFPKVKYQLASCLSLPLPDGVADCVVMGEIIEHMERPEELVKEGMRVLKPGGWLALSTPYREFESNCKPGGPMHLWSFDEDDMNNLLDNPEIVVLKEENYHTMLVWKKK